MFEHLFLQTKVRTWTNRYKTLMHKYTHTCQYQSNVNIIKEVDNLSILQNLHKCEYRGKSTLELRRSQWTSVRWCGRYAEWAAYKECAVIQHMSEGGRLSEPFIMASEWIFYTCFYYSTLFQVQYIFVLFLFCDLVVLWSRFYNCVRK